MKSNEKGRELHFGNKKERKKKTRRKADKRKEKGEKTWGEKGREKERR